MTIPDKQNTNKNIEMGVEEEQQQQDEEIVVDDDSVQEFSDIFYDPITQLLMKNPVVNAAGDSYDQTTVDQEESTGTAVFYPNRALKAIIERETAGSMRARMSESIQWGRRLLGEKVPLHPSFYCPIACEIITDPVIDPDGYSYERQAIETWIRANHESPMTRNAVAVSELRKNNALYELIQNEKNRSDDSIHGSFRRWKESVSTTTRPSSIEESDHHPEPSAPLGPGNGTADLEAPEAPSFRNNTTGGVQSHVQVDETNAVQEYPTTHAQLRARRRRRRRAGFTTLGIVIAILAVFVFAPYYMVFLIIFIIIFLICWRQYALRRGLVVRSNN